MTILTAIEGGMSPPKDLFGEWQIERGRFTGYFPLLQSVTRKGTRCPTCLRRLANRCRSIRSGLPYRPHRRGITKSKPEVGTTTPSPCHAGHRRVIGGVWPGVDRRIGLVSFFRPPQAIDQLFSSQPGFGTREHLHHATRNRSQGDSERAEHRNVVTPAAPRLVRGQESSRGTAQPAAAAMNPASSVAQQNTASHATPPPPLFFFFFFFFLRHPRLDGS